MRKAKGLHLSTAVRRDATTFSLAGDYDHLPEDADHTVILNVAPRTPQQEFVTYERRVGPNLHGVRRRLPRSQNAGEEVLSATTDNTLAFAVRITTALAEAYGASDPHGVTIEALQRFGTREFSDDLASDLAEFVRDRSRTV